MWVNKGKEFYNRDVKDLIELYSTKNKEKSSVDDERKDEEIFFDKLYERLHRRVTGSRQRIYNNAKDGYLL